MTNTQQPECPAEYGWMKPGVWAEDNHGFRTLISRGPHRSEDGDWQVLNKSGLPVDCWYLKPAAMDTDDDRIDSLISELESLRARLAEAEARVGELESKLRDADIEVNRGYAGKINRAAEAKLAQVKALLDGVEPVVDKANRLVSAIDNDSVNCLCDDVEDEIISPFTKFVRQVREVLDRE